MLSTKLKNFKECPEIPKNIQSLIENRFLVNTLYSYLQLELYFHYEDS